MLRSKFARWRFDRGKFANRVERTLDDYLPDGLMAPEMTPPTFPRPDYILRPAYYRPVHGNRVLTRFPTGK